MKTNSRNTKSLNRRTMAAKKNPARKVRKRNPVKLTKADGFTILWLVLFFPVGLLRMWGKKCGWKSGVKYAVSGVCAALMAAILVVPSPYKNVQGGVKIVAEDPEVEIYGPGAPENIVNGYASSSRESVVMDAAQPAETDVTVYAADGADCYHLGDCKFAFASAKRLSVYEAYYLGYRPCGACKPPVYDPVSGKTSLNTPVPTVVPDDGVTEGAMPEIEPLEEVPDDIV